MKEIQSDSIEKTLTLSLGESSNKYLWGKNFPFNSEIKFEYYLNGVHSSYPDFIMKDKKGRIHIFEIKSVNKSPTITIDEKEYIQKINALKECYKECSKKTGHIFYLPILDKSDWQITRFINGEEKNISKREFIDFVKGEKEYKINSDYGVLQAADP